MKKDRKKKLPHKIAGKVAKYVVPITALLAFVPSKVPGKVQPEIIREQKKEPQVDPRNFEKWLEAGWESAKERFGNEVGILEVPRLTARQINRSKYELELSIDAYIETFPSEKGRIIIKSMSRNSLSVIYSEDDPLSENDARKLAAFAYLSIALGNTTQSQHAAFYPEESVPLLYSGLGMEKEEVARKSTTGEALAGFAAFLLNPSDPLIFLGRMLAGDVPSIERAIDSRLGKGAWNSILHAKINGSTEIQEITSLLLKLPYGKENLRQFLSFMQEKFGLDAKDVKVKWSESEGRYLELGDLSE